MTPKSGTDDELLMKADGVSVVTGVGVMVIDGGPGGIAGVILGSITAKLPELAEE